MPSSARKARNVPTSSGAELAELLERLQQARRERLAERVVGQDRRPDRRSAANTPSSPKASYRGCSARLAARTRLEASSRPRRRDAPR
jgi:hypothetical protein